MKRRLSIGSAVLLLVAVVAVVVWDGPGDARGGGGPTTVRGVIGSEKLAFFRDPRVVERFAAHGLSVEVDTAGSRQIATSVDLGGYAFAFPSSSPAAQKIQRDRGTTAGYTPFQSPMAVASFEPVVRLLEAAGAVRPGAGGYHVLDVAAVLELAGTRWDQLPGNTAYPVRKNILVTTTNPAESNSAAMYLAAAAFVANGDAAVTAPEQEARVLPLVAGLFRGQGYTQNSTEGPFEDYLAAGMGKAPLALVYESQYLDRVLRGDGSIRPDMRLLYLAPTVYSKHTLVPLDDRGDEVGRLLSTDAELGRLAAAFGFRTTDPAHFAGVVGDKAPVDLVDVVEPPSFEVLERLLDAVGTPS
ncbi:hypothetical protein ACFFSW_28585 [Saccharothrix longispora]|uniref:Extracellular solute-binding protein n=1 Tax=Saccharothrix longispora TaxID=33920 RepID=A0ABU1PRL8_9PSEU|nr:hypothetical protein [Saccharothrix longispora]MDR6593269.1 hypothetical protein [Saccharothrix longispora]